MAGFKKCGVYPLNPGEVTDRQIAPSNAVCLANKSDGVSTSPSDSADAKSSCNLHSDRDSVFKRRFEEGYGIFDEEYVAWLRRHHPEAVPDTHQHSTSSKYRIMCIYNR